MWRAAALNGDAALNGNDASAPFTSQNIVAIITSEAIAQFMLTRANALFSNQPDLAGFLPGGAGQFAAEITRNGGSVVFGSGANGPIWARLNANWRTDMGAKSQYEFGVIGGYARLSPNLLLGVMVQFDTITETSGAATTRGTGWLIGPYFAAKLPGQPLYFGGSLLYGQTSDTISSLGSYTNVFTTRVGWRRWGARPDRARCIGADAVFMMPNTPATHRRPIQMVLATRLPPKPSAWHRSLPGWILNWPWTPNSRSTVACRGSGAIARAAAHALIWG